MTAVLTDALTDALPGPRSAPPPILRILPIPDTEPAPDGEPYAAGPDPSGRALEDRSGQPMLALALVTIPEDQAEDVAPERYVSFAPQPTSTSDLPDPQAWAARMVQAVLEALGGVRPVAQLVRWTSADVYAAVQRRARLAAARPAPARRDMVRSVRICLPADGVVEASAVVVRRGRVQAVALRLEGLDGRWRMTALELG